MSYIEQFFTIALLVQVAHSIEELFTCFHKKWYLFKMPFWVFLAFELVFSGFWILVLLLKSFPNREAVQLVFLVLMFANGIQHIVWAGYAKKYVPGLVTAIVHIGISVVFGYNYLTMSPQIKVPESFGKKILFIHHSTGGNLIAEGKLRVEVNRLDPIVQFWDHSYNYAPLISQFTHYRGLTDASGNITGQDYNIVLSNNSPKEYAEIFARDPSDSTLQAILSYDLVAFKNCFPTTKIVSESQLEEDKKYYIAIKASLKRFPNKHFVLLTPPPLRKSMTNMTNAKRAKMLVSWLKDEFGKDTSNISVFDLFGLLADENGFLKSEYQRLFSFDSHPNTLANKTVSPVFAKYLAETILLE